MMNSGSARRCLLLVAVAFVLLLPAVPVANQSPGHGWSVAFGVRQAIAQSAPKSFVILITDSGFDSNASIVVNQGDQVQLTFVLKYNSSDPLNHHVIAIDGYNLKTPDINPAHPTASLTFTASNAGTFSIYCDTPDCPIHGLMVSGQIEVDSPTSTRSSTSTGSSSGTSTGTSTSSQTASSTSTLATTKTGVTSTLTIGGSSASGLETVATLAFVILVVGFLAGALAVARFGIRARA